ncbi:polysaccharide deacetylase family protein [Paraburkholderia sp.]|uniref:polysaccharide deacetylase family protein n=1 Tax=Paraburkholderia sp. TaxID=1926495 RepID=UPI0039E2F92A
MTTQRKGTICLSFDFDAVSVWAARQMTTPTPVSRGEFGVVAAGRILHLLAERGLTSTWFVPGHTVDTYPHACEAVLRAGHEIGLHGYLHENVGALSESEERDMFARSYELQCRRLEKPSGFRAPSWDLSPCTIDLMLGLGLRYDSSLMNHDYAPLYCRRGDRIPPDGPMQFGETTSLVEMPVSWTLDDYPYLEYLRMKNSLVIPGLRCPDDMFRNWTDDVTYMLRDIDDGVLTVTFHPQVIGRGHRLLALERWLDALLDTPGLEFARMDRVAAAFADGRAFGRYAPVPRVRA